MLKLFRDLLIATVREVIHLLRTNLAYASRTAIRLTVRIVQFPKQIPRALFPVDEVSEFDPTVMKDPLKVALRLLLTTMIIPRRNSMMLLTYPPQPDLVSLPIVVVKVGQRLM